ncbi:MAG: molybdate ABC transporter substrate-binding protein [candidate division NC10 bacterium]|nr:molybdate ABC transporter substrate-binding protein [candidate division NC10 bacterium]
MARGPTWFLALYLTISPLLALEGISASQALPGSPRPELVIAAAADLMLALREIAPLFEQKHQARVILTFGSTGQLTQQIQHGAPVDVFFAANVAYVEDLRAKGAVLADSVETYARGQIVLATHRDRPPLAALRDLIRDDVRRVAIANPVHAPYGMAAREALLSTGVWEQVQPKLVYGENIRQALQFLQTRNVDAAIIALSVADVPEVRYTMIDPNLHKPTIQAAAVTARSRQPGLSRAFIRFVNGPQGRPIMKRFGFLLPGEF